MKKVLTVVAMAGFLVSGVLQMASAAYVDCEYQYLLEQNMCAHTPPAMQPMCYAGALENYEYCLNNN